MNLAIFNFRKHFAYVLLVALMFSMTVLVFGEQSKEEQEAWKLESDYWKYVQAADLEKYKSLWHQNFVGWPSVSAVPARKDQITDWITDHKEQ
jgi:hypothetical protein